MHTCTNNIRNIKKKERERCRAAWQEFIAARRFKPKQEQTPTSDEPPGGRDQTARQFLGKTQKLR